ncbi:MAG: hypothetical protein V1913_05595 [Fibrobacterota bacterium]
MKSFFPVFIMVAVLVFDSFSAEGYFKDFFNDGGYELYARNPTAENVKTLLGFSVEPLLDLSQTLMIQRISGTPADSNGVLLYPDNSPRFRVFYHAGGKFNHLFDGCGITGQERLRTFFKNGGSWVGSCAGAGAASLTYMVGGPMQVGLWPHYYYDTPESYTVQLKLVDTTNPVVRYFRQFRGDPDSLVSFAYASGGHFPDDYDPPYNKTDFIGKYITPGYISSDKWGLIAYKDTTRVHEGRVVIIGGHPEEGSSTMKSGMLFAAMCKYAADGNGRPRIKAVLQNHETRVMNDNRRPGYEKIGDLQYHQFIVVVPDGAESLSVALNGNDSFDFHLCLKKGAPAFSGQADFRDTASGPDKSILLTRATGLSSGVWYVGVECATVVTVTTLNADYDVYSGNVAVLNGADYSITAGVNFQDNTPPLAPQNLSGLADSIKLRVRLAWGPASDAESGVALYRVYRDNVLIDSVTECAYTDAAGLVPGNAYDYSVAAVNGSGLEGPKCAAVAVTTTRIVVVDNGDPGTALTGVWTESRDSSISVTTNGWYVISKANGATFTWQTPVMINEPCSLKIWWKTSVTRYSRVPVSVYDGDSLVFSIVYDQKIDGSQWNALATVTFTRPTAKVVLRSVRIDSTSCADMVKFDFTGGSTGLARNAGLSAEGPLVLRIGPNPFNPATLIRFHPGAGLGAVPRAVIDIHDITGRRVGRLVPAYDAAARCFTARWEPTSMPSGIYIVTARANGRVLNQLITLVK